MSNWKLKTPVAFLIFNRPDTTERVFCEIAKAKPPKLLVVADGPRENKIGEEEKCAAAREIIMKVNWDCEVITNYSEKNLGCKNRVSSGLDWVFNQVPEAIILEDDCLPHPTFFRFCEEMLERYRYDERIGMISGDNFQLGCKRGDASYYYSRYNHIWGWATWRRAWKHYDVNAGSWLEIRDGKWLEVLFSDRNERDYWEKSLQIIYEGKFDTWDIQWNLACWCQGMISVIPNINLISNIGFGLEATHTHKESIYSQMHTDAMNFPLLHPTVILPHAQADSFTGSRMFTYTLIRRLINKLRSIIISPSS